MQLRPRVRGGLEGAEVPARRQGRQPRRDDQPRPPRAARLHDHHRGLQRVHGRRRRAPRRAARRGRGSASPTLEQKMGKQLGDDTDPLLVSVRSGAPFSMPGMMDTVLNLGLNDVSVKGLAKQTATTASPTTRTAASCRCSARSCSTSPASSSRTRSPSSGRAKGVATDPELGADDLAGLVETFQGIVRDAAGVEFPQQPTEQLRFAIEAVFRSWNGRRARDYRRLEGIPDDLGTAVNVQTMVFGNKGDDSGTGVAFTRDPATGEHRPYGDFLPNAQGEDVVAGIRTTEPLDRHGRRTSRSRTASCSTSMQRLEAALPRHVRHRVHDRAGPPLPAPDPRREAHRGGRAAHGRRDGARGADRQARGGAARPARAARPAAPPPVRPAGQLHGADEGAERVPRRGGRQGLLHAPTTRRRAPRQGSASSSCDPRPRPTTCTG